MKTHALLVLVLVCLILSLACDKKTITPPSVPPHGVERKPHPSHDPAARADAAWQARNYQESQRLYAHLLEDPHLSQTFLALAWERCTASAVENQDWNGVGSALNSWARAIPHARVSWSWNRIKALLREHQDGIPAAERFLMALLRDEDLPEGTHSKAAQELIHRLTERHNLSGILDVYGLQYSRTSSLEKRQKLEAQAIDVLQAQPLSLLQEAAVATAHEQLTNFPFNVLTAVYDLKHIEKNPRLWPQVWQDFVLLKDKGQWAGSFPFARELEALKAQWGHPRQHIALLIPLEGPYASVGWRIAQGAGAGQWYLNSQGMDLKVTLINTSAPDWEQEAAHLTPHCRIIGGPLRKTSLETILSKGLARDRAFFAFMPTVEDEGTRVWRFFGSPRDQVRAMVTSAFANGISRFALVYPRESYGRIMARHFWEEASFQGGTITAMTSYDPKQPAAWSKTVAKLLRAEDLAKDALNPEPDFKAVFLPDTLENAKLLVPQFFFYNENRLLFLGTQLWGQGSHLDSPLEATYFNLALYPGGWWEDNPGLGTKELERILKETGQQPPDFWTALGFDFIRFAAGLGYVPSPLAHEDLNAILCARQPLSWAMAPLSWDTNGLASQDYFVFQPTRTGSHPVDSDRITRRLAQREARRQAQIEALNATAANGTEVMNATLETLPVTTKPQHILPGRRQPVRRLAH